MIWFRQLVKKETIYPKRRQIVVVKIIVLLYCLIINIYFIIYNDTNNLILSKYDKGIIYYVPRDFIAGS